MFVYYIIWWISNECRYFSTIYNNVFSTWNRFSVWMRAATRKHTTISLEKNQTRKCSVSLNCSICICIWVEILHAKQTNWMTQMTHEWARNQWKSNGGRTLQSFSPKKKMGEKNALFVLLLFGYLNGEKRIHLLSHLRFQLFYVMVTCTTRMAGAHLVANCIFKTIFSPRLSLVLIIC